MNNSTLEHNVSCLVKLCQKLEDRIEILESNLDILKPRPLTEGENALLNMLDERIKEIETQVGRINFEVCIHRDSPSGEGHSGDFDLFTMGYNDKGAVMVFKKDVTELFLDQLKTYLRESFPRKKFVILYGKDVEVIKI